MPCHAVTCHQDQLTYSTRGMRFTLSRDELLTLPEFVLLSLFPNGLLPDGHMNAYHDGDVYPVDVSSQSPNSRFAPAPPPRVVLLLLLHSTLCTVFFPTLVYIYLTWSITLSMIPIPSNTCSSSSGPSPKLFPQSPHLQRTTLLLSRAMTPSPLNQWLEMHGMHFRTEQASLS